MILEKIKHVHVSQDMQVYTLGDSGMSIFTCFHDEIVFRRQQVPVDENRRGVLSKAAGKDCVDLALPGASNSAAE